MSIKWSVINGHVGSLSAHLCSVVWSGLLCFCTVGCWQTNFCITRFCTYVQIYIYDYTSRVVKLKTRAVCKHSKYLPYTHTYAHNNTPMCKHVYSSALHHKFLISAVFIGVFCFSFCNKILYDSSSKFFHAYQSIVQLFTFINWKIWTKHKLTGKR